MEIYGKLFVCYISVRGLPWHPRTHRKAAYKEESSVKEGTCQAKVEIRWYQAFKEEKIYITYQSLYVMIYIIDFI